MAESWRTDHSALEGRGTVDGKVWIAPDFVTICDGKGGARADYPGANPRLLVSAARDNISCSAPAG